MLLVTQSKASEMPYAPSRQYLGKLAKEENRPAFFVEDGEKILVNVQHPEWEALLERRRQDNPGRILKTKGASSGPGGRKKGEAKKPKGQPKGKKPAVKPSSIPAAKENPLGLTGDELHDLIRRSQIAGLEEQIIKNEIARAKAELEKMKLKREAGELIEFKLAEFLFLGYLEKLNVELLSLTKKLEPIIDNLVKERDTRGVLKRFSREFENIINEVKKAQEKDLQEWDEERGEQ